MVVESRSGLILGMELMLARPSLAAVEEQSLTKFMDLISQGGSLPQQIAVRNERLYHLLTPLAAGLGIQLRQAHRMPAPDQARGALQRWLH